MEEFADLPPRGLDGPLRSLAKQVLELGEHLFDGIEVGAVFGQEEQSGPDRPYRGPYCRTLVGTEVVHDDDIAGLERRNELRLDVEEKRLRVDRPVQHPGGLDPVVSECADERHRVPVACGCIAFQSLALRSPASERCHVRLGPCFVDEDEAGRVDTGLPLFPALTMPRNVRALLLVGERGFF